ncbi:Pca regulon regulatory protein [compost metagenome]
MSIRPGSRVPMYCTGSGRLWLASLSGQALDGYFERNPPQAITPYTLTDETRIRAEITLAAQRGYVLVDQEYEVGMRVLSVPLIDREGQLQAALTLTTHASRMTVEQMRERYLSALYEGQALLRPIMTL